jgi:ankyrin repeat protein
MWGLLLVVNAAAGDIAKVRQMLDRGVDPNAADSGGWTALHLAAGHGHLDVVRALLDRGADPARPNKMGDTPLHVAVVLNQLGTAQALLEHKGPALLGVRNGNGAMPKDWADRDPRPEAAQVAEYEPTPPRKASGQVHASPAVAWRATSPSTAPPSPA